MNSREFFIQEQEKLRGSTAWEEEIKRRQWSAEKEEICRMLEWKERPPPQNPNSQIRPRYTSTPIPRVAETLMIQYIGGPFNSQQKFFPTKERDSLLQGGIFREIIETDEPLKVEFMGEQVSRNRILQTAAYKSCPIPPTDTPFAEGMIVIIALYQENS